MFDMYVKLPPDASPIAVNKFYLFTYLKIDILDICEKKISSYEHETNSVWLPRNNMKKWRVLNALYEMLNENSLEIEPYANVQRQLLTLWRLTTYIYVVPHS